MFIVNFKNRNKFCQLVKPKFCDQFFIVDFLGCFFRWHVHIHIGTKRKQRASKEITFTVQIFISFV